VSTIRRRGLQIDDPLTPTESAPPVPAAEPPASAIEQTTDERTAPERNRRRGEPVSLGIRGLGELSPVYSSAGDRGLWRSWSGITSVGSFRLPHELLAELSDNARELGLPVGLIVTAAITQLLDQPDEQIAQLVDKADDARIHGRRTARRRLTDRTDR
jgi:hypothetical protein